MHNVSHDYQLSHKWATIYHINRHPRICETHKCRASFCHIIFLYVRVDKTLPINLCILDTNIVIQCKLYASKNAESFT